MFTSDSQFYEGGFFGTLVAFTQYMQRFYWPLRDLADRFTTLQSRYAALIDLWDRGLRAREEGRPGPFAQPPPRAPSKKPDPPEAKVLCVTAFSDPMHEMDKLHSLYDTLMDARRQIGDDVVPFHRFAALVKDQVTKLRETGSPEVAFRVAMKASEPPTPNSSA